MPAEPEPMSERLLVVSHSETRGRSIAAGLRREGFAVERVASAPAASPGCPIVFVMGEIEALERLAALAGGAQPVIAVDVPPAALGDALARGADEAVARNAGPVELAARIRWACGRRRGATEDRAPAGSEEGAASHALSRGELEALLQITEAATSHLELEDLLRVVVDRIAAVVPTDRCSAILLEDEDHALVMASHDVPDLRRLRIEVDRYPEVRAAVESRAPVVIDDLHTHPLMENVRPLVSGLPVSSLVVAPLVAQGDAYGALLLRLARNRAFGPSEQAFVRAAASAVANSVRNARLHTSVRQKRDELEAAYQQRYEELNHANEQLREANRIKDELLAMCSHDLRSPLNTLLGHARLLQEANLPERAQRSAEAVERQGKRLLQLVQHILERGRNRTVAATRQPVDLAAVARSLAEDAVGERGVRVVATGDATAVADGDGSALRQVLENLVSNAISHSPAGAEVEVEVRLAGAADHVRVEVRDRGPGIPAEELPLVFERYRKSGASSGLGLGLAICREIVEQHGGAIWAAAREGGGTCFVFTVPVRDGAGAKPRLLALCSDESVGSGLARALGAERLAVARTLREGVQQATLLLPEAIFVESTFPEAPNVFRAEPGLGEIPLIYLGEAPGANFRSLPLPLRAEAIHAALAELKGT